MIHSEILVRRKSRSFVTGPNMVIYTVDRLPIGLPPCPVPTAKMVRGRKQGIATKIGAPDHFSGFKLAFLVSKAASYQQCMDSKTVPEFYNKVTKDFISKYGGTNLSTRNLPKILQILKVVTASLVTMTVLRRPYQKKRRQRTR
jgi:hypothetical protein